jgi:hypothetical protein
MPDGREVPGRHQPNKPYVTAVFLHDVFEYRNDHHKSDCGCAVCQVIRRKKEKDEIMTAIDNETTVVNSSTFDQHNLEVSIGNLNSLFTCVPRCAYFFSPLSFCCPCPCDRLVSHCVQWTFHD